MQNLAKGSFSYGEKVIFLQSLSMLSMSYFQTKVQAQRTHDVASMLFKRYMPAGRADTGLRARIIQVGLRNKIQFTVEPRYLELAYFELPLISKWKSGPCFNMKLWQQVTK